MTLDEIINSIERQYAPLSEDCKSELIKVAKPLMVPKNTILVKEGQYSNQAFFIVKGCTRAYYLKDGKDITDWFAFENDFISSINSFFSNVPSPHYIEVLEDAFLIELKREDIDRLSDQFHDFERLNKVIITKTMLQQQERIVSLQFQSSKQRYARLIEIYPNITQRVLLSHIASYIGITLETLSRIRRPNLT
jgi:CRP-like cAMP-binding protein